MLIDFILVPREKATLDQQDWGFQALLELWSNHKDPAIHVYTK